MVFGERGVGKTTFLHRLLQRFHSGKTVGMPYITINCVRAGRQPAMLAVFKRELERVAQLE